MKKSTMKIITIILVFAILGATYYFITRYQPPAQKPTATAKPQIPLVQLDVAQVSKVSVTNENGAYAFVLNGGAWALENALDVELNQQQVLSLCYSAATFSASELIAENPTDLTVYGLDTPTATVTVTAGDATAAFLIGTPVPGGDGNYCKLENSPAVYRVPSSTASMFAAPLTSYRVLTITALETNAVRAITITGGATTMRLIYHDPPEGSYPGAVSTWRMESPIVQDAENQLVTEKLLTPLCALTAANIVADRPVDLTAYGFTGDSVTIETEKETIHFQVGFKDGNSYIYLDGKTAVYFMNTGTLPFMAVTPFDVLEKMTNLITIDTVKTIALEIEGVATELKIENNGDNASYFVNNAQADEAAFKSMYIEIAGLTVDGMVTSHRDIGGETPHGSIVYTLTDNSTIHIAYYDYDELHYAVYENDENTFFMKKAKLTALAAKLAAFAANPRQAVN